MFEITPFPCSGLRDAKDHVEPTLPAAPLIDIIIPVWNEDPILELTLQKAVRYLDSRNWRWSLIVADNGSTDASLSIARRWCARDDRVKLYSVSRPGRGGVLRQYWMRCCATYSLYMDADLSTDLGAVDLAVDRLQNGAHVVLGNRWDRHSSIKRSAVRTLLSQSFKASIRILFPHSKVQDAQCGFKGIDVEKVGQFLIGCQAIRGFLIPN